MDAVALENTQAGCTNLQNNYNVRPFIRNGLESFPALCLPEVATLYTQLL